MLNCIIVEDELPAQKILQKFIEDTSSIQLKKTCNNAFEAFEEISQKNTDLVFLDINMPKLSGINFLKSLNNPPMVIFTTAYAEYAVEGFELNALDYLLKPFSYERFLKAVQKATEQKHLQLKQTEIVSANIAETGKDYIYVRSDKKDYRVLFKEIVFIEACGDYLKLQFEDKILLVNDTMKNFQSKLPSDQFIRIHKSYIIQSEIIEYIEGNQVAIRKYKLPVGAVYKDVLAQLRN